jgi:hypothetical protein
MASYVTDATLWHINADEPPAIDYDQDFNPPGYYSADPYRSSDHDPVLIGLDLTPANQPPIADAGFDQGVKTNAPATLNGSGSSDPDDDLPLAYCWTQTGGPSVSFSPALSVTTFTAPGDPAVLTFRLAVTDTLGLPDPTPDEVVVTVNNQAPVANAGSDRSVDTNAPITLDGSGSSDPDGDLPLTYHWMQTGDPAVAFTTNLSITTFIAPSNPTVLTFTLVVTDNLGLPNLTPDEVTITVKGYRIYLPLVVQQDKSSTAQARHTRQRTPMQRD